MTAQHIAKHNVSPPVVEQLKTLISNREDEVNQWFEKMSQRTPPFFYTSVDLRHSGYKLAPVDTNLFPGGFNNLNPAERQHAPEITAQYMKRYHPNVKRVLIISEEHTRNSFYLENVAVLKQILENSGFEVHLSNFTTSEQGTENTYTSHSGIELTTVPLVREGDQLKTTDGFTPDMVLVNNDLTGGAPDIIENISQLVTPPLGFGWYKRRKTSHFESYNNLARDFCREFNIDPWLITTVFEKCGIVNFGERKGIECVALKVDKAIQKIKEKYQQYGITDTPYVFIKSDRGTYGMGIMTAQSGDEVFEMNKNIRKKMNKIKGGTHNTEVIIQEGIPTIDQVEDNPAEPMLYLIGGKPVGCIFRLNTKHDAYGNLNASGMSFASISDHASEPNICKALSLISRIAALAASWECYVESYDI